MSVKNTDLTHRSVNANYTIEDQGHGADPESLMMLLEEARIAGEEFEGYALQAMDFGYRTPCSAAEVVEAMCRRGVIDREEKLLPRDPSKVDEDKWKRKVRRRKLLISEELPRKLRFYEKSR